MLKTQCTDSTVRDREASIAYGSTCSVPSVAPLSGLVAHMVAIRKILDKAVERKLDVFISVGSLASELTDVAFNDACGVSGESLAVILRRIVDVGAKVRILVCANIGSVRADAVAVSPAVRDLLLAPGLPGSGEKPVIIRSTGFEPAAADGVFHFTIATNAKQTPAPHQEEWYVRAESFHVPTDEAHALRTMGDSLKGILAMNNERAAELGRKLMGDFDRLFVAAGKRALAGDDGGLMKLNGDSSFVRRVNVQPVGIVAPV